MTDAPTLLAAAASAVGLVGIGLAAAAWSSLRRGRWTVGGLASLSGLALLLIGVLGWGVVLSTRGYRALTREELAATVTTRSLGPASFEAVVRAADATRADTFRIAGDQLYVDAHVLRWHPWVNVMGIHTGYRLARIGGRYASLEEERSGERTVYELSEPPSLDLIRIVDDLPGLGRLVDAAYGSGAFVPAAEGGSYEVRVTTSGLIVRGSGESGDGPGGG